MMNPNNITYSRFVFGVFAIVSAFYGNKFLFIIFFALAVISDIFDGFIARRLNKESEYGKRLDIIADNFIVICVFLCLYLFNELKFLKIFLIIFFYFLLIQLISISLKKKIIFHRSVAANLAAIIFPIMVLFMIFSDILIFVHIYAILMIYSLTEKLFLSFKLKKDLKFYLIIMLVIILIFFISKENKVCFSKKCITVEVMDTPNKRALGLMYRTKLDEDEGMLFLFERPGIYQFYMKNMLIPIDMIFIDESNRIIKIFRDVMPCGSEPCELYFTEVPISYVVETRSNFSQKYNLNEGEQIILK